MNAKVLKTLEYNKILAFLKDLAVSQMAKDRIENLKPFSDYEQIEEALAETSDATSLILRHSSLPLGGIKDIRTSIKRLQIGANLSPAELLEISELLRVAKNVVSYANQCGDFLETLSIHHLFESIDPINPLYKEITRCILSEEEIADDASPKLQSIRREIAGTHQKIRQHLNRMITSNTYKNMLQDALITIKNDRFCVPIKAEYRGSFPGMIHEQSASGSTLFIEPLSVVEFNNKLKEYLDEEAKEIERILAQLSAMAANYLDVLQSDLDLLSQLDFIFAKGELALRWNCSKPVFNTDMIINLKKARHPLLDPKTVVPTDVYIGETFKTLVITGPNTGGKTVTLKTVGLLSLMGQSGLFIPTSDGSQLTVLDEIFADIGDEQSIEQSLSTFSSHMKNIIEILDRAHGRCLVLFDELGAGTDPTEGAALATAILENLFARDVLTIATTHYSELKVYALSTKGVENASQEFDIETLRPTYKLLIGIPGKSNAFAISKRLGLSDDIIEASKKFLEGRELRFEDLITDLEINKKQAIIEKEKAERYHKEAQELQQEVQNQKDKIEQQRNRLLKEAKEQAHAILTEAKAEADAIIREMNAMAKNAKSVNIADFEKGRSKLRDRLSDLESQMVKKPAVKKVLKPEDISTGDSVYVAAFNQNGIVITPPNSKGEVEVQLGIMKTKVSIDQLELMDESSTTQKKEHKISNKKVDLSKALHTSTELDLRGQTTDEALINVEKYLDDAYLAHLSQVTIIHGKGTGTLRQAIHNYLRTVKYVKSYRLGIYGEGETGVTIVEFK